jgi:hypothetical protein
MQSLVPKPGSDGVMYELDLCNILLYLAVNWTSIDGQFKKLEVKVTFCARDSNILQGWVISLKFLRTENLNQDHGVSPETLSLTALPFPTHQTIPSLHAQYP